MNNLDEFIGSVLSSLSHARRIADEESIAIAEYYKDNPLLENLSIPRLRIPEMTLDIPVLIETISSRQSPKLKPAKDIVNHLMIKLTDAFKEVDDIPTSFYAEYEKNIISKLTPLLRSKSNRLLMTKERVIRLLETTFTSTLKTTQIPITRSQIDRFKLTISELSANNIFSTDPNSLKLSVNTSTSSVKETSTPDSIARIKLTLKEEGLEWNSIESATGETKRYLEIE
ncbi:hypothetical protein [uncultured Shewanella sp.]|uniref:hypothetical protein n=1 Tax=uncultured Shewanella sp. TaxID=173975 RepID=UPI0026121780|nr:hypothetical protein [uncultured Shewanella sp.]